MPHIYIDGQKIEARAGATIIEAAYENGMQIPHFCWHPELSVAGNCRMCLVEVGMPKRLQDGTFETDENGKINVSYMPKLQIACGTPISDGMHIRVKNDKVVKAQEAVMEFLLINHPLDCPICDEAGQCKLQDYAFNHSKGESRFEEEKNHKDKRQVWGQQVIYDAERCISCSRCIRFAQEVPQQDVLTFVQRGDKVTIKLFEGTTFDNAYSMNVIDICPVGALTSSDFRFKSRVWDMSFNDSICTGCSRGCNTKIGVRNNEILRIEPDTNMHVNKFWMCDDGRLNSNYINENRISSPGERNGDQLTEIPWKTAIEKATSLLKKYKSDEIMFVASAKSCNENNYLLQKFAKKIIKTNNIDFTRNIDNGFADNILRTSDRNANNAGCELMGISSNDSSVSIDKLPSRILKGDIKLVFILEENIAANAETAEALAKAECVIYLGFNHDQTAALADLLLPASTFAELEGTYINVKKRVQLITPALVTNENRSTMGLKLSRLDKFGALNDRWTQKEERNCKPSWKIIQMTANLFGSDFKYNKVQDIFDEMTKTFPLMHGMNYALLEKHKGLVLGKADNPDKIVPEYKSHVMRPE